MSNIETRVTRRAIIPVAGILGLAMTSYASELTSCVSIDSDSERLACYDRQSGREESIDVTPVQSPESAQESIGSETLPGAREKKKENVEVQARVIRCGKNSLRKNLFYFENGQIWKQVSDRRVNLKTCDFAVTITKDTFGYKMQRHGEKSRIRISRIK